MLNRFKYTRRGVQIYPFQTFIPYYINNLQRKNIINQYSFCIYKIK